MSNNIKNDNNFKGLTNRSINCLHMIGINNLEDLNDLDKLEEGWKNSIYRYKIKPVFVNAGHKTIYNILKYCTENDIKFDAFYEFYNIQKEIKYPISKIKDFFNNYENKNIEIKVITLCGSSKFKKEFNRVNKDLTLQGNAVFSLGVFLSKHYKEKYKNTKKMTMLKEIHKKKIDLCDEIFVIDVGGYIGENTKNEIEYAKKKGKNVRYYSKEYN